jgi:tetratricopeptide (TPR) repeat protein
MGGDPLRAGGARRARRWRALASASLLALALAACDSPEEKAAKHLERGIAYYEAGDDARAMVELSNVLRLQPKSADALFLLGRIHERAERLPHAYEAYQAAVAEKPDFVAAQAKFGALALVRNNLDAAERAADAVERIEPNNPDGLAIRGAVMLRRGDLERALDTARQALAVAPEHENAMAVVLGVLNARGRQDDALTYVNEALARVPKSLSLRQIKLVLLTEKDDDEAVVETFGELIELEPESSALRLRLAGYHQTRGEFPQAETVLREALARGLAEPELLTSFVRLVYQQKGAAAAEEELRRLIEQAPEDRSRQMLLAQLYVEIKQPAEAEAVLRRIIDEEGEAPAADDARARLAQIRIDGGDREGANALADEVLARHSDHREANFAKGLLAFAAGDPDETIRRARSALTEDPSWPPAQRLLAAAHLKKGERELAIDALNSAVRRDPDDTVSAARLASLLTERGDYDAALDIWGRVIARTATPGDALRARAGIAIRRQDWATAQADIKRLLAEPGFEVTGAQLAGDLAIAMGETEAAREWFARALATQPDAPGPLIGIVRAYIAQDDLDGAIAYLDQQKASRPEDAVPYQLVGELYLRRGEAAKSAAAFREAIRLRPSWVAPYAQLALAQESTGDADGAIATYQAWLGQSPRDLALLVRLAETAERTRRIDTAIEAYRQIIEIDPNLESAVNNYAALVADHRTEDTMALARALTLAGHFGTSDNGALLDTLGWLHYRTGDTERARGLLERAVLLVPDHPQIRYHLGMVLLRTGNEERARAELTLATRDGVDYVGLDEARTALAKLQAEPPADKPGG